VTRGREGLLDMTFPKVIIRPSGRRRRHYHPVDSCDTPLFLALLEFAHGGSFSRRLRGVCRLLRESLSKKSGIAGQQNASGAISTKSAS